MEQINRYLIKQLLVAFALTTTAITAVILFTQSFRLLSLVIENASTMMIFFKLMALTIPTLLPLVMPIALGIAALFTYHRLALDSEIVVMRSAGISATHLANPALLVGGGTAFLCLLLTLWGSPWANKDLAAQQYEVRNNFGAFLTRSGNFNDVADGVTFYSRRHGADGTLAGILMHDVRDPLKPITLMADTGQIVEKDGQQNIVIFNGRRQEMDIPSGHMNELMFDQYVLDLKSLHQSASTRAPDPREQDVVELLSTPTDTGKKTSARLWAEINQRLALPLLPIAYVLIGLAAILAGDFNRRGMAPRVIAATVGIVATQSLFMSFNGLLVHNPVVAVGLYALPLMGTLACWLIIRAENGPLDVKGQKP